MDIEPRALRTLFVVLPLIASTLLAQKTATSSSPSLSTYKEAGVIEFVKITPGEFMMGCSAGDEACLADEKPAHRVRLTRTFEIGKYEVTQAQWQAVMGSNPSAMIGTELPVESISKGEAQDFLNRLNGLNDSYRYRLPSEAEWEYAARAGGSERYAGTLDEIAWYAENSLDETHPVGRKKPNAWGLYDMEGNVREWVQDFYSATYYSVSPPDDPTGPAASTRGGRGNRGLPGRGSPPTGPRQGPATRGGEDEPGGRDGRGGRRGPGGEGPGQLPVMRGGAWDNPAAFVRVSARYNYYGDTLRVSNLGFRAVREQIVQ